MVLEHFQLRGNKNFANGTTSIYVRDDIMEREDVSRTCIMTIIHSNAYVSVRPVRGKHNLARLIKLRYYETVFVNDFLLSFTVKIEP